MRFIKMLGLAAAAALAVMAFAGATSAMAETTLLCSNPSGTCTEVTHFHFLSVNETGTADGKGKLLAGSNTVECELLILGDRTGTSTTPFQILADLTYTNCNLGCSVTSTAGGASIHGVIDVLRLGTEELADVTGLGFEVKLTCPFIFTCDYNAEELTGHGLPFGTEGKGHTTYSGASVHLVQKLSGPFNCASSGALDALLKSLTAVYIRA